MRKITRTWSLMSACWQVLKQDKGLLLFPLISGICCLLLLASFAIPLYATGSWVPPKADAAASQRVVYYSILFLFYFSNYFVVVFFNAAIVACAAIRMGGGNPTVGDGFRAAASRLPVIVGWALVSATVGLILRLIEDRSDKVGRFVAGLLGTAWTVASFLVVPILVMENKNPIAALRDSTILLKKTWGEQLTSNFSFGMIFFLLSIPGIALIFLGIFAGSATVLIVCAGLAVAYLIVLGLIQSALHSIFQAALYLYVQEGKVPDGFQAEVLSGAIS
jgi:heme/copper-type cytochrome/quinol oxidase subunit 4